MKCVEVEWLDAQSSMDRWELEELKELEPLRTKSIGYLVKDDKEALILAFTDFGGDVYDFKVTTDAKSICLRLPT